MAERPNALVLKTRGLIAPKVQILSVPPDDAHLNGVHRAPKSHSFIATAGIFAYVQILRKTNGDVHQVLRSSNEVHRSCHGHELRGIANCDSAERRAVRTDSVYALSVI